MCNNPDFWDWVNSGADALWYEVHVDQEAAKWMRRKLGMGGA